MGGKVYSFDELCSAEIDYCKFSNATQTSFDFGLHRPDLVILPEGKKFDCFLEHQRFNKSYFFRHYIIHYEFSEWGMVDELAFLHSLAGHFVRKGLLISSHLSDVLRHLNRLREEFSSWDELLSIVSQEHH